MGLYILAILIVFCFYSKLGYEYISLKPCLSAMMFALEFANFIFGFFYLPSDHLNEGYLEIYRILKFMIYVRPFMFLFHASLTIIFFGIFVRSYV